MNDWAELALAGAMIVGVLALAVFAVTLPSALLGWLMLAFVNVFGAGIDYGYWDCFVVGLVTAIILAIFTKIATAN